MELDSRPLADVKKMTRKEMIVRMKEMEDIILAQMLSLTPAHVCQKCALCGEESNEINNKPTELKREDIDNFFKDFLKWKT